MRAFYVLSLIMLKLSHDYLRDNAIFTTTTDGI